MGASSAPSYNLMFTFLPYEERQAVAKEYKKRLLLIYVAIVMFAGVAWIASLVPSYVLVTVRRDETLAQKASPAAVSSADASALVEKEIALAKEKLSVLRPIISQQPMSFVLAKLFSRISQGISLSSISVGRAGANGTISISGIATTRDTLVSFSKTLEGEAFFKKVELPVSNFTRGKDVPFTMSLTASF